MNFLQGDGSNSDAVVNGSSNSLLAAQEALGRLNRYVSKKELDLFQFSTCCVAGNRDTKCRPGAELKLAATH